jgi:intracellular sulfur oxidation DsrE/DsrF family protein
MPPDVGRRAALLGLGSTALGVAALSADAGGAVAAERPLMQSASELRDFSARLCEAPRRRDFKTVPMILDRPDLWDAAALDEVIAYRGAYKQVWDNTVIDGPWLNFMRNSINAQVFSFLHPDFLAVSATHGTAHLALFDQPTWEKYQLANLAGGKFKTNTLILAKPAASAPADHEDPNSVFGPGGDTMPALQSRGVVFLACHNAIWELSAKLLQIGANPDHLSHGAIAAELTNHLIDGAVLTPGMVATIPELQRAGFHYVT